MKFIDSNILAYAFYENEFTDKCQYTIKEGGIINTVNLIEAFNIIKSETNRDLALNAIKGLLKSNLKIIGIDINIVFETLKRAQKYKKMKFIDLIHYLTATENNCESLISYDKDFDNLEIKREEPQ